MTNAQTHAKRELDLLDKTTPDNVIKEFKPEILALCEAFGKSGQSGGSAPFVSTAISVVIKKLMMFETLVPLTGEDDEWNTNISSETNNDITMFQNNRDSRVFKNGKDGKPYFIDAIVFNGDIGGRFTGYGSVSNNGKHVSSSQFIKEFPFTPKTFYVDVIDKRWKDKEETEEDPNGDWWTHTIKDENQLKEVFEYYNEK